MSSPTNIPETPMGEPEQDSYFKSKEKFYLQLQHVFQKTLKLIAPDQFDQLCQWMEYKQFQTFDDFYDFYCSDSEKLDAKNPEAEYKWKGKTNYLSANVAHKLKSFVQWMAHEKRPHDLHDDYLSTLTRENYFNFRFLCTQSPTLPPSHHEPYKHQVKKRPQRKAFFPQQEGISDDDENTNEEEQFSTDQEPEEPSPYSVYQSSSHPKMPQKSFLPPNIWGTPPESTKQMIIEHNKKVKLNNPTPYLSGSKTKPNPPLGKPTPTSKQVHQHSQDEPTGESKYQTPSKSLTALNNFKKGTKRDASALPQFLTHHNCDDLDPTETPSAVPTALQTPSDDTSSPFLMKPTCAHNPSTNQVSKSYHANPVPFPYPPDPGEHVLETSTAQTTLVERDNLDLSSLLPPKGEMESSFSWTCPFKSPTSSTLCFGEPTLGKINQETDVYMTKPMPKPSSGANQLSVSHSSLVTKNGEHFSGENFIHDFPKSWKHIKEVDWGDKLKTNYTTHGYMLMEIDWGGKFNYTSCGHPMANWQGHATHPTGHKTSEVDWGGHDPNEPDNPPPMYIINLDDLLGRTFLLPMDENGERKRATISEHVKDLCQQQVSREDQLRFKLKIDGDQPDDIISYNQLMEYLEDKTDTGPLEDGLHRLKCIKDHKGPYTSSEVDWGGHDPYNNHVNESLLSEVDWGAHNPYADDPEQLTGESIQSFLTSVVQLQWLVTLGRLVTHAQVTTLSKLVVASS